MLNKDNSKEEIKKEIKKLEKIIEDNDSSKKEKAEAYKKIITIYPEISDEMYPVKAFIKEVPYGKPGANRKKSRKPLEMGGLLQDDKKRMGYEGGEGVDLRATQQEHFKEAFGLTPKEIAVLDNPKNKEYRKVIRKMEQQTDIDALHMELEKYRSAKSKDREPKMYGGSMNKYNEGGSLLADDIQMPEETSGMKSDDDMEEDYVEYVMSKLLSEKEQEFLNKELEGNDKLSVIFDKVVGGASEFSGSGPIDGPGTGVSDDIPARLSDGEFVFTAKAVEEIGEDALASMMKEAEAAADNRQGFAFGGILDTEEEEELQSSNISDDMRRVNPRLNPNLR